MGLACSGKPRTVTPASAGGRSQFVAESKHKQSLNDDTKKKKLSKGNNSDVEVRALHRQA